MPSLNGNLALSKTVLISGSLIMGSGAVYFLYKMYAFSRQVTKLNSQMTILADRLFRAEANILQLYHNAEQSSYSDDADDEFVDAPEENQEGVLRVNSAPPSDNHSKRDLKDILQVLDNKTEERGVKNLTYIYKNLNELSNSHPTDDEIFWRISRTAYLLAEEEMLPAEQPLTNKERYKELMAQSKEAAQKAVQLNPKSGDAHRWMAIVIGSLTQYMAVPEQIKSAFVIKEHIETAICYKPDDALLYYMLGRWCYSVYMLSWMERKLASALFATPPTATLEEALKHLLKAESLSPLSSIQNVLYLSKAYIAKGDYCAAVEYLKAGMALNCSFLDDRKALEKIEKLYKQYKSYGSNQ